MIGLIYDSTIDPSRWTIAMEAIRLEIDYENASLELIEMASSRVIGSGTCNIPDAYLPMIPAAGPDVIDM